MNTQDIIEKINDIKLRYTPFKLEELLTELAKYVSDDNTLRTVLFHENTSRAFVLPVYEFVVATADAEKIEPWIESLYDEDDEISDAELDLIKKEAISKIEKYKYASNFINHDALETFVMQEVEEVIKRKNKR